MHWLTNFCLNFCCFLTTLYAENICIGDSIVGLNSDEIAFFESSNFPQQSDDDDACSINFVIQDSNETQVATASVSVSHKTKV